MTTVEMITQSKYSDLVEKYENMGFLESIVEERKEFCANSLEKLLNYMSENTDKYSNDFGIYIFPTILRISRDVDFSDEELLNIVNEFEFFFKENENIFVEGNKNGNIESAELLSEFTDNKIKQLKNK